MSVLVEVLKDRVKGSPAATGHILWSLAAVRIGLLHLGIAFNNYNLSAIFPNAVNFREECAECVIID